MSDNLKSLGSLDASLEACVNKYQLLQKEIENLTTELETLKPLVIEMLEKEDGMKFETLAGVTAKLTKKVGFKYLDEAAMIAWCEKNKRTEFIQKKIVTSALNTELKKGVSLTEALNPYYTEITSYTLTVK